MYVGLYMNIQYTVEPCKVEGTPHALYLTQYIERRVVRNNDLS